MTQYRARTYSRQSHGNPTKRPAKLVSDPAQQLENDSPPFLPFSAPNTNIKSQPQIPTDPSATLRITSHPQFKSKTSAAAAGLGAPIPNYQRQQPSSRPITSHSSSSSTQSSQPPAKTSSTTGQRQSKATMSSLSPRQRRHLQGTTTSGSEGNSGIGSSFSDLDDDFSGTQSALEEALAGEMEKGGVASRMSSLSQALRSKYL